MFCVDPQNYSWIIELQPLFTYIHTRSLLIAMDEAIPGPTDIPFEAGKGLSRGSCKIT